MQGLHMLTWVPGAHKRKKGLLSQKVKSLWDGSESDSIPKAKLPHCSKRVSSAYRNEPIPYQLFQWWWEESLPAFETCGHHSLLWHAEALFFRRGMEAMPWRVHAKKTRSLSCLSSSKRWPLKSRQLIWKMPNETGHSHISSARTHTLTYWQALTTSQKAVVAVLDRL